MRSHLRGICEEQCEHVLQLIAKAEGATRLIEPRSAPEPGRDCLIEEPAVQHQIHRRVRRSDFDCAEKVVPPLTHPIKGLLNFLGAAIPLDQFLGLTGIISFTQLKNYSGASVRG